MCLPPSLFTSPINPSISSHGKMGLSQAAFSDLSCVLTAEVLAHPLNMATVLQFHSALGWAGAAGLPLRGDWLIFQRQEDESWLVAHFLEKKRNVSHMPSHCACALKTSPTPRGEEECVYDVV